MEGKTSLLKSYFYYFISIPVYALLYLLTALTVLICLFLSVLNLKKIRTNCIRFWAKASFLIMGVNIHVHGTEFLEKDKNYLLLANHTSLFDIMAIMAFFPNVSWFGREYLIKIPVFGSLLKSIDYIPMVTANVRNTKVMLEKLVHNSKGLTIAMFPEGTRTIDGRIGDFRRGFIHVLRAAELDVLPVTIKGLYELKPKTRFYIKFDTKVDVFIHQPIPKNNLVDKSDKEIILKVKDIIESVYY